MGPTRLLLHDRGKPGLEFVGGKPFHRWWCVLQDLHASRHTPIRGSILDVDKMREPSEPTHTHTITTRNTFSDFGMMVFECPN